MATIIPVKQGSGDFAQLSLSGSGASFLSFLMLGTNGSDSTADLSSWLDVRIVTESGFQLFRPDFNADLTGVEVHIEGTNAVDPAAADPDISTPIIALGTLNALTTYIAVTEAVRFIRINLIGLPPPPVPPAVQIFVNVASHVRAE